MQLLCPVVSRLVKTQILSMLIRALTLLSEQYKFGKTVMFNPLEDGITHINAYSKSKQEVGRAISNFAYAPYPN